MSCTEIYAVTPTSCRKIGETRNGHRSAMYVWRDIAVRYFGLDMFPMFDEDMMSRIWNAQNEHDITDPEQIVLASTMDCVAVKSSDKDRLVEAFRAYHDDHPNSSLGEQAEIIASTDFSDDELISWNQTSVSEFEFLPECDDEDECTYNDLSSAWDLFEQIDAYGDSQ